MEQIAIIDYGMGNIRSVQKACAFLGYSTLLTEDSARLLEAPKAILPGVGAFSDAMAVLRQRGFDQALAEFAAAGRPLLGICLGMQLMFAGSTEGLTTKEGAAAFAPPGAESASLAGDKPDPPPGAESASLAGGAAGLHRGLGFFPGIIRRFPAGLPVKVPHIGWNQVARQRDSLLFAGLPGQFSAYFVHSYLADDVAASYAAGITCHGVAFVSAVERGMLMATQFHPEKSGAAGLAVLRNFLALAPEKEGRSC
jgi:glutamine amidotransferase